MRGDQRADKRWGSCLHGGDRQHGTSGHLTYLHTLIFMDGVGIDRWGRPTVVVKQATDEGEQQLVPRWREVTGVDLLGTGGV